MQLEQASVMRADAAVQGLDKLGARYRISHAPSLRSREPIPQLPLDNLTGSGSVATATSTAAFEIAIVSRRNGCLQQSPSRNALVFIDEN
jgi:hypothetical protein